MSRRWQPPTLESVLHDLRYALRTLRRESGFAVFAVLIVGLGIGASATVFSVVNTLLLRPLPFRDPSRLVWIYNHDTGGLSGATTQVSHLLDLRSQNRSFSDVAGFMAFYGVGDALLTSGSGEPERLSNVPVSSNFFQVLGVQPVLGRLFTPEECKWNGPNAVLLSYNLWVRRFNSDRSIPGRTLIINGQPTTVAGVLPASFDLATVLSPGSRFDLYSPFPLSPETDRWGNTMAIIARLKSGVTPAAARAEVKTLAANFTRAHRERNDFEGGLVPLAEHVSGQIRPALLVLVSAVAVVMLIVCANLSNLLLSQAASRQKEIAVRMALGAGRARLLRQLLTECLLLSSFGAALGVLFALAGIRVLAGLQSLNIPLLATVRVDFSVLAFCLAAALATGILFGLAPAFAAPSATLHDALKDTPRGSSGGRSWLRSSLVAAEIAFASLLLVAAGLLVRSFLHVLDVRLGFQPDRAAAIRVDPARGFKTQAEVNSYIDETLRLARNVPGVSAAGLTDTLPLGRNRSWGAPAKGVVYPPGQFPDAYVRVVTDGYREAMGIPLVAGRDLSPRDTPSSEPVIVINETAARALWPGRSAVGQLMEACGERRVAGVIADVRHLALEQTSGLEMYLPMRQCRDFDNLQLVLRTSLPPSLLAAAVRSALHNLNPDVSGKDFVPLQSLVDHSVSPRRFLVILLGGFALFALLLASLGIYAVVSYSVNRRTLEIGIRMALGASASRLQASILGQTLALAAAGLFAGAAASLALARALSSLLYGVSPSAPLTFLAAPALLTLTALAAAYLPARRASQIDPATSLRTQ